MRDRTKENAGPAGACNSYPDLRFFYFAPRGIPLPKDTLRFNLSERFVLRIINKEAAEANLDVLAGKWGEMYPIVIKSWRDNWERLTEYFQYTPAIRKLIYTTNTVEGYHRQVRKVTKTKGVFPTDTSLEKLVYLAYRNIRKKWTMPISNWGQISQQLAIKFGDRFKIM